jgi:hypothetical protein
MQSYSLHFDERRVLPKYMGTKSGAQKKSGESVLTIRVHLTDGSVHSYAQTEEAAAEKIWDGIEPSRMFAHQRIVIGSEHSKSVFVASEVVRVDFVHKRFTCWEFPGGYSDIVELTESEFRKNARLDDPKRMVRREVPTPVGDLLVSFCKLHMRGGRSVHVMIEVPVKLPAESQSFMNFMLSRGAVHMRLRAGGVGVLNLANLAGYTVYPGVAQIPADSWMAEPESTSATK